MLQQGFVIDATTAVRVTSSLFGNGRMEGWGGLKTWDPMLIACYLLVAAPLFPIWVGGSSGIQEERKQWSQWFGVGFNSDVRTIEALGNIKRSNTPSLTEVFYVGMGTIDPPLALRFFTSCSMDPCPNRK